MSPGAAPTWFTARTISSRLTPALNTNMRAGSCVIIDASFEARINFLLGDYDYFIAAPEWLNSRLNELRKLQSREAIERWKDYVRNAQWSELVRELLEQHYDPLYRQSQSRNFSGMSTSTAHATDDLSPSGIDALANRIISIG